MIRKKTFLASVILILIVAPFAGMYFTQNAAANTEPPSCPLTAQSGRIIVNFTPIEVLHSNKTLAEATAGPYPASIPEGSYKVTLVSFDNHSEKPTQIQPNESWFLELRNSSGSVVQTTAPTGDLPADQNLLIKTVHTNLPIGQSIYSIIVKHAAYPDSNANSIRAICAAFDKNAPKPVTADIKANGSDGPISIPFNTSAVITWSSTHATSCTVSPAGWTGTSGSKSTGNLTASKAYTLTCVNSSTGQQATDSVTVNVGAPNPPAVSISANPNQVFAGDPSVLSWTSTNADTCTASGGWSGSKSLAGSQTVTPTQTTIYTITCSNAQGSATAHTTVTVSAPMPQPTVSIIANPSNITQGQSSILSWASSNADTCFASSGWFGVKSLSGNQTVTPHTTTTYTVTCSNAQGQATQSATVTVTPVQQNPPAVSISANPNQVFAGDPSVLSWTSTNADTCTASGGWSGAKALSGNQVVSLFNTTTYTITCSNNAGQASDSVTVFVTSDRPLPTVSIFANPVTINQGQTSVLSWTSSNADTCFASGGWSGAKALSGSEAVSPANTATYTITCSNIKGQSAQSVTVSVQSIQPTVTINASPTSISKGQQSVLVWNSSNATQCFASNGWSGIKALSGSQVVTPETDTTYTITCTNSQNGQSASDSETILVQQTVVAQPSVFSVACSASTASVQIGKTVTFVAGYAGGTNPISFAWSGDVSGTGQIRSVSFNTTGTKTAVVSATDATGQVRTASCSVQVTPATIVVTQPPTTVVTTATQPPQQQCCCCGSYAPSGNGIPAGGINVADQTTRNGERSLLASAFTNEQGDPSVFLYLIMLLLLIITVIAIIRSNMLLTRLVEKSNTYPPRHQQYYPHYGQYEQKHPQQPPQMPHAGPQQNYPH